MTPYIIGVNQVGTVTEVLESALNVIAATPKGSNAVFGVTGQQVAGSFVGGTVQAAQVNTTAIGDTLYHAVFLPGGTDWAVINQTTGDTLGIVPAGWAGPLGRAPEASACLT